jgi:hypothetical protein
VLQVHGGGQVAPQALPRLPLCLVLFGLSQLGRGPELTVVEAERSLGNVVLITRRGTAILRLGRQCTLRLGPLPSPLGLLRFHLHAHAVNVSPLLRTCQVEPEPDLQLRPRLSGPPRPS